MLALSVIEVEEFTEEGRALRYIEHLPIYQLIATYLNANGGKDPKAKKLPANRAFVPEGVMRPWAIPAHLQPLRFTAGEAQAILDALPHLKGGGNWVFQALVNRVMPLGEIRRAAGHED